MRLTVSKLVALAIAVAEVIAGLALEKSWAFALTVAVGALLPLVFIWFPEFVESLTDGARELPLTSRRGGEPSRLGPIAQSGQIMMAARPYWSVFHSGM
jgi:hypothetical protein